MNAVKTLMLRSLDYAGLFPPAQLPMNEAIDEFCRCRGDADEWLLARFVLPAARIGEFAQRASHHLAEAGQTRQPWHVSALLRTAGSIDEALAVLRSDAQLIRGLADSHPDALVIDSCELLLPEEVINSHDQEIARGFFAAANILLDGFNLHGPVFWEVNLARSFEHIALAAHQTNLLQQGRNCLKFRTGGLTAAAIVSSEHLARAFRLVQQERVPFKLTAGLHLAMRHFDAAVGTDVFGFLNVFSAAVLGWTHGLSESELKLLLEEKDFNSIRWDEQGLTWKNYHAKNSDIRQVRSSGLKSFGSCSFYEPIEDLKLMKLID